ncbi:MAG: prepilin-type N-terminal cleavage/methylation domain-containing protein [Sulfuritalea sp.]|nr:prepilin-type N-terminal cleavage/methylation domain-containing protein [Sulfuritalea sp.]
MNNKQSGFTLIEIAIVLVIIGLLLGGVLKGQELINSAKVKNFATDFRNIPLLIYGYQDKFKALPGDDAQVTGAAAGRFGTSGTSCTPDAAGICAKGNGVINGVWTATAITDETFTFWQHARLAGLGAGPTNTADANYLPRNADGGLIGIESGGGATGGALIQNGAVDATTGAVTALGTPTTFSPTYLICSEGILGKYAKQLDTTLDDGQTATGNMRVITMANRATRNSLPVSTLLTDDATSYVVCMGL